MGKKYNVYDEDGKLVAQVEKPSSSSDDEWYDKLPLFVKILIPEAAMFFISIFYTPIGMASLLYVFLIGIQFYLLSEDRKLLQGLIFAIVHIGAYLGVLYYTYLGFPEFDGYEVLYRVSYAIILSGLIFSAEIFSACVVGLVQEHRLTLDEKKRKKSGKITFIFNIVLLVVLVLAAIYL